MARLHAGTNGKESGHGLMGWYLRRSIRLGPLRINLSRRGVGYSVGISGARIGRSAQGRQGGA